MFGVKTDKQWTKVVGNALNVDKFHTHLHPVLSDNVLKNLSLSETTFKYKRLLLMKTYGQKT